MRTFRAPWPLAAVLAAATAAVLSPLPTADAAGDSYVALGDSYTAGPNVAPVDRAAPSGCARSTANYPHLVASALGLRLDDRSCTGAKTENVTTTAQFPDQPPQITALTSTTKVVTLGIGGNDNNTFRDVVAACLAADSVNHTGTPCKDTYGSTFVDNIHADAPVIGAAIARIHQISPAAKVFVVGYPDILPPNRGCYPRVPITDGDAAYIDGIERELNAVLRDQAHLHNAIFVDTYTPSVGYDACQPAGTRWIEPVVPGSDAATLHPNAAGMRADAVAVTAAIRNAGTA
ncbi:SGNH/GDSL hydrolase family protein [Nocardia sp. CDC159]|uniref:SGNH/GDSL hydrolase family protein n=1 Tax=Nocardia pulmonis TaxID=2951408 RepID=A0A9X2E7N7_9NOCA|nr:MULTISPECIES: SGNH/GDSL hydrolase family protein [Nocardia]MCM6773191.1 SGNH/GDSL hydrolase family protein [Nocardia pulmonis]MCM6785506.1 SGNH/GDSL hydrolase family protein [Nocardia sp. CDC159]